MATDSIPQRPEDFLHLVPSQPVRVELYKASEVDAMTTGPAWVIDGLLQEGVNMLYGASGTGKTFVALDMAMHIAQNEPVWHGRRVSGGPVVYVAAEDGLGARMRRAAWRRYHDVSDEPLFGYDTPIYLHNPRYVQAFIEGVQSSNVKPALIVFDTLARCVPGVDENSNGDMGVVIDALERIRQGTETAAVLVVHHTGKYSSDARGASAIRSAMQGAIQLTGSIKEKVTLKPDKQRNGAVGESLNLTFRSVGETFVIERGNEPPYKPQAPKQTSRRLTRDDVLGVVNRTRGNTESDADYVAAKLGILNPGKNDRKRIQAHLTRLATDGLVTRGDIGYKRASAPKATALAG